MTINVANDACHRQFIICPLCALFLGDYLLLPGNLSVIDYAFRALRG